MSKMISLGVAHDELYGSRCCSPCEPGCEDDDKLVYPEVHVSGPLADRMGAGELRAGEEFVVPVLFRVRSVSKSERDEEGQEPEIETTMTLCLKSMGREWDSADDGDGDEDTSQGSHLMGVLNG